MTEDRSEDSEQRDPRVTRRRLLLATSCGVAGAAAPAGSVHGRSGAGTAARTRAITETDHDHAGDHLGVTEPVESITVDSVSIRDFEELGNFLVYEDGGTWYAFNAADQEIWFEGSDGVAVVNSALEEARTFGGYSTGVASAGEVRVVADDGGTVLESSTTIQHVHHGVTLVLEPGVTFEFTGDGEAVHCETGNNHQFFFDVIDANGADYCIRDVNVGTGRTIGNTLRGASDALWVVDLPEGEAAGAGHYVNVREFDCTAHPTPYGFRAPSPDVRGGTEGYWFDIGIVRGPTEVGIRIGDEEVHESVGFFFFEAFVDGATNDARHLVEINDKQNGVLLRGFTPATGGDWDVVKGLNSVDCPVLSVTRRQDLRVKRETLQTANPAKFDEFGPEVVKTNLSPESLDDYETVRSGSGDVVLDGEAGRVEHRTGTELGSRAGLRRSVPTNSGISFDQQAAIQTSIIVPSDLGYEAWLLWGEPDGPAVGWRVASDQLLGYASDGASETTEVLVSAGDLDASDAWNLTAFYNPPTDVYFYADDLVTETVRTADGTETTVTARDPNENLPVLAEGPDPRFAGRIDSTLPSGSAGADTVMTIELANTVTANRTLRWSNWKNHRYPHGPVGGDGG